MEAEEPAGAGVGVVGPELRGERVGWLVPSWGDEACDLELAISACRQRGVSVGELSVRGRLARTPEQGCLCHVGSLQTTGCGVGPNSPQAHQLRPHARHSVSPIHMHAHSQQHPY